MVEELKKDLISKIDGKNATQEKNNEIEDEELLNFVNKKRNLQQLGAVLNNEGREKLLEVLPSLEKVLENSLDDIYNRINEKNRQNTISNWDYYTKLDGILIQLYANIKYGENLALTGTRLGDDNAKKTNLYMWRFELERRSGMIEYRKIHRLKDFSDLLDIPNLSALLSVVGNQEQQNRVFDKFLNFFLNDVKVNGMFFENQIGNENLTALLNYLILAEIKPTEKVELE
ncbi:MAG: hypothetical protein LBP53_05195 [Candidatus Peribacteria bacterium]|nr:hypothetical protein [Candidatus Peribacteria bacterium]